MISLPTHSLNDGTTLPALGLGTWPMDDAQAEQAVRGALELGYRLLDTATRPASAAASRAAVCPVRRSS